jgi:hypothetical protein
MHDAYPFAKAAGSSQRQRGSMTIQNGRGEKPASTSSWMAFGVALLLAGASRVALAQDGQPAAMPPTVEVAGAAPLSAGCMPRDRIAGNP